MPAYRRQSLLIAILVLIAVLITAGSVWINYQYVKQDSGANDFVARWLGTRLFLLQGLSPYDEQLMTEAQNLAYDDSGDSQGNHLFYLYPFYSIYFFTPFTFVSNFNTARAIWMTVLEISVLFAAFIGIRLSDWRLPRIYTVLVLLFSLTWFYSVLPILAGNVAALVVLLIAGLLISIKRGQDILAGILLALSTIKPEVVVILALFVLVWAVSKRRWLIVSSFFASLGLLIVTTLFIIPDWLMQYIRHAIQYFDETSIMTPGVVLYSWLPGIGRQLGWALTGLMVIVLLLEWRAVWNKDFRWFYWTASLTLVATTLIGIPYTPMNYIVLLPALILVLFTIARWWGLPGRVLMVTSILFFLLVFWVYFFYRDLGVLLLEGSPFYTLLLPLMLLFGLYWVRWWAIQKKKLPLEEIKDQVIE